MPEKKNEITFNLYPGELEYGVWCEACALPSAVRLPIVLECDGRLSGATESVFCIDCDWTAH